MKKMNKKGFTLIELLAVIVVLAIVMVIATQKITDVINSSRSNAFISSYKMIVKQINTNIVANPDKITCSGSGTTKCEDIYDISDDYKLTVLNSSDNTGYTIELTANGGKFANLDLTKYGDASTCANMPDIKKVTCIKSKIDNTATSYSKNSIIGTVKK